MIVQVSSDVQQRESMQSLHGFDSSEGFGANVYLVLRHFSEYSKVATERCDSERTLIVAFAK